MGNVIFAGAGPLVTGLLLSSAVSLAGGCAYGEVRQVLRAQFASEVGCSDVKLSKRSTWYVSENPNQYKISGCGVVRTYSCTEEQASGFVSYDEPACSWEEGDSDAPKMKQMPAEGEEPMDDMGDAPMDEPMPPADDMDDSVSEPPAEDEGDDGLGADANVDADAEPPAAPAKSKAKVKGKAGFKLGS